MILVFLLALFYSPAQNRVITIENATIERNRQGTVFVDVDAVGDENTFGLSINFDPSEMTASSFVLASGAPAGAALIVNSGQSGSGRIGLVVSMPIGQTSTPGHLRLVAITFMAKADKLSTSTSISFSDQPIARQLIKADASSIPTTSVSFVSGTVTFTRTAAIVSAASFTENQPLPPSSIAAAFALHLATGEALPQTVPLPTSLAGTTVVVKDFAGIERPAPLFYAGPNQVNFLIPDDTVAGRATISVTAGDGTVSTGTIPISVVSPALFSADSTGGGFAAGDAYHYRNGEFISQEPLATWDGTKFVARPIDLGPETDQVFLVLYGTGFRFNGGLSAVQAVVGGRDVTVAYAGPQGYFVGEDQMNVGALPRSLIGAKQVNFAVSVAGRPSNIVTVEIK